MGDWVPKCQWTQYTFQIGPVEMPEILNYIYMVFMRPVHSRLIYLFIFIFDFLSFSMQLMWDPKRMKLNSILFSERDKICHTKCWKNIRWSVDQSMIRHVIEKPSLSFCWTKLLSTELSRKLFTHNQSLTWDDAFHCVAYFAFTSRIINLWRWSLRKKIWTHTFESIEL